MSFKIYDWFGYEEKLLQEMRDRNEAEIALIKANGEVTRAKIPVEFMMKSLEDTEQRLEDRMRSTPNPTLELVVRSQLELAKSMKRLFLKLLEGSSVY